MRVQKNQFFFGLGLTRAGSDVPDKHGNVYFEKGETKAITLYFLITDEEFENETLAIDFHIYGSPDKGTLAIVHEPETN